jgi:threonine/homoserine/homoserine lactone efflux protein
VTWTSYGSFLAFAIVLVLIPGPDFAVVTRNTLVGGRRRGGWSAAGVASSNAVQGMAAAAGLGAVIVRVEPLFQAVKWAGIGYLLFLGVQAFRSAKRANYPAADVTVGREAGQQLRGWRQGFLSNITNPKVLVFYLAVLPQFLGPHAPISALLLFALSHAMLSLLYLSCLVTGIDRARRVLARRRVRRALDVATGTALIGFSARLAAEHA